MLRDLGATPAVADALDAAGIRAAVLEAKPDAIVQLLTALPEHGPMKLSDLRETNLLRREATSHLLAAAIEAGATRYVSESIVLAYGYGDNGEKVFTEDDPVQTSMLHVRPQDDGLAALASLEEQVLGSKKIEGIVLRFGLFYGPSAGSTRASMAMLRKRMLALPGGGHGVNSWVHTDDVATAVVAALERGRAGEVYNIVDDEPVMFHDFITEMARAIGAPEPWSVPAALSRVAAPYVTITLTSILRVSNEKAKRELGWTPRYPTYREGMQTLTE
jgi:nucleoside-diphosphate-sugar epimerase